MCTLVLTCLERAGRLSSGESPFALPVLPLRSHGLPGAANALAVFTTLPSTAQKSRHRQPALLVAYH